MHVIFIPLEPERTEAPVSNFEILKEVNESIRHWEALLFSNAEKFFTVVAICVGAAGAVVAWSDVAFETKRFVITLFLGMAAIVSVCAVAVIWSTKNYLSGFYNRRANLKGDGQKFAMRSEDSREREADNRILPSAGKTVWALTSCFIVAAVLCPLLIWVSWGTEPKRPLLAGARLEGANLSAVRGLTQSDLDDACGDAGTKVPAHLSPPRYCQPVSQQPQPTSTPEPVKNEPVKK
jgi:hypothetical protein